MQRRYRSLFILLSVLGFLLHLGRYIDRNSCLFPPAFPSGSDAETALAFGRKFSFEQAGIYELELIPGISDTLASRIVSQRFDLRQQACSLEPQERSIALERLRGIGPAKSRLFYRQIDFNCP